MRPDPRAWQTLLISLTLAGCAATTPAPVTPPAETAIRPEAQPSTTPKPPRRDASAEAKRPPQIDGEIERRRMKIWGEVKVILRRKHAQLPALERKQTESTQPPYTTIYNDTPHALTVWLAGPCVKKLKIASGSQASAEICAGKYVVAAQVDTATFLPLVRADQQFAVGVRYALRIQIRRQPKTIRKRRWVR